MAQQRIGIIMNGITGRMGMNQHLIRSIVAIREQGGHADARVLRWAVIVGPYLIALRCSAGSRMGPGGMVHT